MTPARTGTDELSFNLDLTGVQAVQFELLDPLGDGDDADRSGDPAGATCRLATRHPATSTGSASRRVRAWSEVRRSLGESATVTADEASHRADILVFAGLEGIENARALFGLRDDFGGRGFLLRISGDGRGPRGGAGTGDDAADRNWPRGPGSGAAAPSFGCGHPDRELRRGSMRTAHRPCGRWADGFLRCHVRGLRLCWPQPSSWPLSGGCTRTSCRGSSVNGPRMADYSHGFFVAPLAAFFVWERRDGWQPFRSVHISQGCALLALSLCVFIAGRYGSELFLTRVSMIGVVAGLVLFLAGWAHLKALALPDRIPAADGSAARDRLQPDRLSAADAGVATAAKS